MGKKVFVSYSHVQGDWVWQRLVPCLRAAGVELLIDEERMKVGHSLIDSMDALQDAADTSLLTLSPEYLNSSYCQHELSRALARGTVLPVLRKDCEVRSELLPVLRADLRDDRLTGPWDKLIDACEAELGVDAPSWLSARDDVSRYLDRGQSVNLLVSRYPKWRPLVQHLNAPTIDLDDGTTAYRAGLVRQMLCALGHSGSVPDEPKDLGLFSEFLHQHGRAMLCLIGFDHAIHRSYGVDLFSTLRFHIHARRLVLLIESRVPLSSLLPRDHPLSSLDIRTVELRGR